MVIALIFIGLAISAALAFRAGVAMKRLSEWRFFSDEQLKSAAFGYGPRIEIAGTPYENRGAAISRIAFGDTLLLVREPRNRFDRNAVAVLARSGYIGYLPREDAEEISKWIDGGERVAAYVASIGGGPAKGRDAYRVWINIVSTSRISEWAKDAEERQKAQRADRKRAKAEAIANGWEVKKRRSKKAKNDPDSSGTAS